MYLSLISSDKQKVLKKYDAKLVVKACSVLL